MDLQHLELPADAADPATLRTDDDYRREARRLLPAVLARLAGTAAGGAWDQAGETYRSIGGMSGTPSPAEKEKFLGDSAAGYEHRASPADRQAVEDAIVRRLRERAGRG